MPAEDIVINAQVRRAFAKHWIDVTHVSHRTVRGHVHVTGRIVAIASKDTNGDESLMGRVHAGILSVTGVKTVQYNLENWVFDGTAWRLLGSAQSHVERQKDKAKARKETHRRAATREDEAQDGHTAATATAKDAHVEAKPVAPSGTPPEDVAATEEPLTPSEAPTSQLPQRVPVEDET